MARLFAACLLSLWLALAGAEELQPLPALTARVTDLTATLTAPQAAALEQKLAAVEAKKGAQLVVLILPTTQPETIEQFGTRLLEAWKVGRKGVDDGAILLVAKNDRRLRIAVGYGLEGALNDATAKRIIAEIITPRFKTGDLAGGIDAGVDALIAVVAGEALPAPVAANRAAPSSFGGGENVLLIGLVVLVIVGTLLRNLLGNFLGALLNGGIAAGIAYVVTGSVASLLIGGLVGAFAALIGLNLLFFLLSGGRGGGGGFGGFSGGGGSGGGGGASGRW